ncbi:MAG TPA: Maf family protein [Tepidisphaeraceae bacterium]|nr:Maf family protein [Tepidisphaeraceae bacterium]
MTLAQHMTEEGTVRQRRLVLASASPRRQQLLRESGYEFAVFPANIDEDSYPNLLPLELARHLSFEKAKAVAGRFPHDVVLAADTVVAFGDRALSKPEDAEDARRMLSLLSGTTHIVITGVTLMQKESEVQQTRAVMSAVRMRVLSPAEIDGYIAGKQWEGKAGAYGIQDDDPFVTKMSGSHSNIVGLPMEMVEKMLAEMNILPVARGL